MRLLHYLIFGLIGITLVFHTTRDVSARAVVSVNPLAFNAVSAMAKEKDVMKAGEALLKDESTDIFFELVGGVEKALTTADDAEILGAIQDKVGTIQTLYTLGMQFSEGKYTDAALTITDAAVGKINNPAVTAVWEMLKVTRESYIAVASTKAALDIELLYSTVNKDRMLIGVSSGGAPPTIAVNAQTADYFFNKYLITNPSVRGMVRSYVENVLGQTWPEQSWSNYAAGMMAIGSGIDTKEESELRQLQGNFKNIARGWIVSLLTDLNKQVTLEYHKTRLIQEMAEYEKYSTKIANYNATSFPAAWKTLLKRKNATKNIAIYKKYIAKVSSDNSKATNALKKASKPKDKVDIFKQWKPVLYQNQIALANYAGSAFYLKSDSIYNNLKSAEAATLRVLKALYDGRDTLYDGGVHVEEFDADKNIEGRYRNDPVTEYDRMIQGDYIISKYMRPLIISSSNFTSQIKRVDSVLKDIVALLNKGDFRSVYPMQYEKLGISAQGRFYSYIYYDEALYARVLAERPAQKAKGNRWTMNHEHVSDKNIWKPIYEEMRASMGGLRKCLSNPIKLSGAPKLETIAAEKARIGYARAMKSYNFSLAAWQAKENNEEYTKRNSFRPKPLKPTYEEYYNAAISNLTVQWKASCRDGLAEMNSVYKGVVGEIGTASMKSSALIKAYKKMAEEARVNYSKLGLLMTKIQKLTNGIDNLKNLYTNGKSLYAASERGGWCKGLPKLGSQSLYHFGSFLTNPVVLRKLQGGSDDAYLNRTKIATEISVKNHQHALSLWKEYKPLSQEDMKIIEVLARPSAIEGVLRDGKSVSQMIEEIAERMKYIPAYITALPVDMDKFIQKSREEKVNCEQSKEKMMRAGKDLKKWQGKALKDKTLGVRRGKLIIGNQETSKNGMFITKVPYRHYLTNNELKNYTQTTKLEPLSKYAMLFLRKFYPKILKQYEDLTKMKGYKPASSNNFIDNYKRIIYIDNIKMAERKLAKVSLTSDSFPSVIKEISQMFPQLLRPLTGVVYSVFEPRHSVSKAELESDVGQSYVELSKFIQKRQSARVEALNQQLADKQRVANEKREEERNKSGAGAFTSSLDRNFYWIIDPRYNTEQFPFAAAQLNLTKDDLVNEQILITGRLNSLDNITKILLSTDGRSWKEMPRAHDIRFAFTPAEGTEYHPLIKLLRKDGFGSLVYSLSNKTAIFYSGVDNTKKIATAIKTIAETYERQNLIAFSNLVSTGYLGNKVSLEEGVRFDFEMFTNIGLKLYINRITKAGKGRWAVDLKWDKTQIPRSRGSQQRTTGRTVMTLIAEEGVLKIQNLRGDLLYATLSPDIAAASGLSTSRIDDIRDARNSRTPNQPGAETSSDGSGGGSSGGSGAIIAVQNASKIDNMVHYHYDFDNATWATPAAVAGSDMSFESLCGPVFEAGTATYVNMSATKTFATLSTAPDAGYGFMAGANIGDVYAFKTSNGLYGKFILDSSNCAGAASQVTFRYAIQADGSKNIATQ